MDLREQGGRTMEIAYMKMLSIITIAIAAVFILACIPGSSAAGAQAGSVTGTITHSVSAVITKEQAEVSVRNFMGDPNLMLVFNETEQYLADKYYKICSGNSYFMVNKETGVVEAAVFPDNNPVSSEIKIPHNEALARAKDYVGSKCTGFSGKTWNLVVDTKDPATNGSYTFLFQEEKDAVLLPSLAIAEINPQTAGIVVFYHADYTNTTISLKPAIPFATAARNVGDLTNGKGYSVDATNGHLALFADPVDTGNQRLTWVVRVNDPAGETNQPLEYYVDANNGAVIWTVSWQQTVIDYFSEL